MKTIQISDELYEKLERISKEMNSQNHRGTRAPYIFQILVPDSRETMEGCEDFYIWTQGGEEIFRTEHEDLEIVGEEWIRDNYDEDQFDEDTFDGEDSIREFLYDHQCEENPAKKIERKVGFFLTHESAKRHWEANKHHYPEEFNDYLDHCWRDPDMEAVQQFLFELTGGKLHT